MANLYAYIDGNYVEADYLNSIPYEPTQSPQIEEVNADMYYEPDYIESGYLETFDPGDYVVDGYFDPGYIDSFVYGTAEALVYVNVSALLEKQPGEVKEFEASLFTDFAQSVDAGIIFDIYSAQSSEFAQEVAGNITVGAVAELTVETSAEITLSNIYGADLFAFSEAALAAQVDRIRDINLDAITAFDVAVDYVRVRDNSEDAAALFDALIEGLRSRDTNMETQAAFSFDITADKISSVDILLQNFASLQVNVSAVRSFDVDLNSESTLDIQATVIKQGSADLQAQVDLVVFVETIGPAEIIEMSADIISVAAITASLTGLQSGKADLLSTASVNCQGGKQDDLNLVAFTDAALTATANSIKDFESFVDITADIDAQAVKTANGIVNISGVFADSTLVAKITGFGADITSTVSMNVEAVKFVGADAEISSAVSLTALAARTRDINISAQVVATETVKITTQAQGRANLVVQGFVLSTGAIYHIDEYVYVIPRDIRTWNISADDRFRNIDREDRNIIIRR